ncbi:TPA: restriction endonuclease subunit S [Streptococcus equi subsp. zooepidemicus]|nr:restriction endonuclease subunit S [Streptococcus equi subsp. zooepidemicus]
MKDGYQQLGKYIRPVDERNRDLAISKLLGVSITKQFIPSIANIVGTDLSNYKIVRTGQFAYGPVTSRNGEKISVALLEEDDCIISSSYSVFEVIDKNELNPEYLMLWFSRPEFDRYARYRSHGSVREIFDWDEMCQVELPVPDIDKQNKIVDAYRAITDRIALKQKINDNLEDLLTATFKQMFVDDNSVAFESKKLKDIAATIDNRGKTPPNDSVETPYPLIEIASLRTNGRIATYRNCSKYVSEETYNSWFRSGHPIEKDILMSTVGSLAELKLFWGDKGSIAQNIVAFRCHNKYLPMYLYQYLLRKQHELAAYEIGSVQASIKVSQVVEYDIDIPSDELLEKFDRIATSITEQIYINEADIDVCHRICAVQLQQLSATN